MDEAAIGQSTARVVLVFFSEGGLMKEFNYWRFHSSFFINDVDDDDDDSDN